MEMSSLKFIITLLLNEILRNMGKLQQGMVSVLECWNDGAMEFWITAVVPILHRSITPKLHDYNISDSP